MEANEIKKLLERYYEGESTLSEEKQLHTYFLQEEVLPGLEPDRDQFLAFTDLRAEDPNNQPGHNQFFQKIDTEEEVAEAKDHRLKLWGGRIAASVALILGGFLGGIWYGQEKTSDEVVALREDFQDMRQTMLLNQLQRASASERIQVIQASLNNNQAVSEALLLTVSSDPNVNVRLAAIEALKAHSEQETVRIALAQTLNDQDHPMIQIAIINQLVTWGEKGAVPELQRLVQQDKTEEIVRQQAEFGISQLML
ncbi:HEAT repeat domain-containing protein [Tunicatimonas pelagia]|uniref:HEAT repeat domain-containing protein n=1 Tax=Tunicatimonas pelagia TaxID=931531 RepID=UPI00266521B7|nr:HEAT repeat domain-containing protein [Tunicatimonas pelagia]WKN42890.1 HEAT repeat domain-containing protein [Tunicatimonas pelagia]